MNLPRSCSHITWKVFVLFVQSNYDEKNIRRRVYDALNVLLAIGVIQKDKKTITWSGLPRPLLSSSAASSSSTDGSVRSTEHTLSLSLFES